MKIYFLKIVINQNISSTEDFITFKLDVAYNNNYSFEIYVVDNSGATFPEDEKIYEGNLTSTSQTISIKASLLAQSGQVYARVGSQMTHSPMKILRLFHIVI